MEITDHQERADVVAIHAGELTETFNPIVVHNHGLYWTGDFAWRTEYWQYNAAVIEALRRADAITTPSEWTALPIRRDMRKSPVVIPHGVNADEFEPQSTHAGYVLWAKPRVDIVSTPDPMQELAKKALDIDFVSTYGRPTSNVRILGAMSYDQFKVIQSEASVWLATTRETGDIASREAMLQGIPVLGWNWGATAELVTHLETGWLATPGDYDSLVRGLYYCIDHRERLGANARQHILENYQWRDIIPQYLALYQDILNSSHYPYEITVVVPTYNYAHFLPECLDSILEQTFYEKRYGNVQIIVVDDCSTDTTQKLLSEKYPSIRTIRHSTNQGLPAALNTGMDAAEGKYLLYLDADNLITPWTLETFYLALEQNPSLDVASGGLAVYDKAGDHKIARDWPFGHIDPLHQLQHINQLTSTSMMRLSSVKRLGGYRVRQRKNEDGEFWCRAVSAGLRLEQVTDKPCLVYRWHELNKSKVEGGEDDPMGPLAWDFYYPWKQAPRIMPFASTVPPHKGSWAVRSYEQPHIAVCIPCGPGHDKYIMDALDSVYGQTYQNFECIVANDTGKPLDLASMGHPWVKVIDVHCGNPADARNAAISAARAPLIVPLDADDMLYPNALSWLYRAWLEYPENLAYMDCETEDAPGHRKPYKSGFWTMAKIRKEAIYQDVILFAKQWWEAVGGYPNDVLWEDWVFGVMLHLAGIGATYIEGRPWGVYRHWTALDIGHSKSDGDNADFGTQAFKKKVQTVYDWIARKEEEMACRKCGKGRRAEPAVYKQSLPEIPAMDGEDYIVLCERVGSGMISVNSRAVPRRKYRVSNGDIFTVPPGDRWIGTLKGFRILSKEELSPGTVNIPDTKPTPPVVESEEPPEIIQPNVGPILPPAPAREPTDTEPAVKRDWSKMPLKALEVIPRVTEEKLRRARFTNLEDIRQEFLKNHGRTLMAIPTFGRRTVSRIKEIVFSE